MYEERRNNFSIANTIIQILFIVIFVFLLIWLFPTKSDVKKSLEGISFDDSSLKPLYDRIFIDNILMMKDAAKDYYTTERLPKNVGDSVSMTLGEMLDKNLIVPFTDSNGNQCDLEESYVKVTNNDEEYLMKVNLSCSDQENYILVHMGCYNYCKTDLCEKKETDVKTPVIYPSKPVVIPSVVVNNNNTTVNNNNTTINNNTTNNNTETPSNPTTPEQPTPDNPKPDTPTPDNPTPDNPTPDKPNTPAEKEYIYEYIKITNGSYTNWSSWSDWSETKKTGNSLREVQEKTIEYTVQEQQIIGYNTITYKDENKPIYGVKQVLLGISTQTVCDEYQYVTTSGTSNTSYGAWVSQGIVKLYNTPVNTATTRYIKISVGTETCGDCGAKVYTMYRKETRSITQTNTATESTYKCTKTVTNETPVYGTKTVITDYQTSTKKEPIYGVADVVKTKTYYRYRTRQVTEGKKSVKWSNYNDTSLLNNGYEYTGNKKEK